MREAIAEALVGRALLFTLPEQDVAGLSRNIAALLDDSILAGLTSHDVLLVVVAVGRAVLPLWDEQFPHLLGPPAAVAAAEAWAVAPSAEASDLAAHASELAVRQAIAQWQGPSRQAAWAGRTTAWVATAPKYDWPAISALFGACQAIGRDRVSDVVAVALADSHRVRASPGTASTKGRKT